MREQVQKTATAPEASELSFMAPSRPFGPTRKPALTVVPPRPVPMPTAPAARPVAPAGEITVRKARAARGSVPPRAATKPASPVARGTGGTDRQLDRGEEEVGAATSRALARVESEAEESTEADPRDDAEPITSLRTRMREQATGPADDGPVEDESESEGAPGASLQAADTAALETRLQARAADALARLAGPSDAARTSVRRRANTVRAHARSQSEAAAARLSATFARQRTALEASLGSAREQVRVAAAAADSTVMNEGEQAREVMTGIFSSHRTAVESSVSDGIRDCEDLRTRRAGEYDRRAREQARLARQRGNRKANTFPRSDRGWEQRDAAYGTAERTAREIEARIPEAIAAIEEIITPIPEELEQRGREALQGFDDGLPELLEGIDTQVAEARAAIAEVAQAAEAQLDEAGSQARGQLEALENAALGRVNGIAPQVEAQLDAALPRATSAIDRAERTTAERIESVAGEAVEILSSAESPEASSSVRFAEEVEGFVDGAAEECVGSVSEAANQMSEHLGRSTPMSARALRQAEREATAQADRIVQTTNGGIGTLLRQVDESVEGTQSLLVDAFAATESEVRGQLEPLARDFDAGLQQTLSEAEGKIEEAVREGLSKNDEGLGQLDDKMTEAAAEAAWDYDHPVLSAVRDVAAIIAGVIVGILVVLVLVVAAIVAFKLLIAGLVALGLSTLVATIVVAVAGLALMAVGIYSAYQARRQAGQGAGRALAGAVADLVGISDIGRAFSDESLSPFERGYSFGKGVATVASFFLTRGLNRRINARLPQGITNPNRGVAWRWFRGRGGRTGIAGRGYRPQPGERVMTRDQWRAASRQQRIAERPGLENRGYRPARGERSIGRQEWQARWRAARIGAREVPPTEAAPMAQPEPVRVAAGAEGYGATEMRPQLRVIGGGGQTTGGTGARPPLRIVASSKRPPGSGGSRPPSPQRTVAPQPGGTAPRPAAPAPRARGTRGGGTSSRRTSTSGTRRSGSGGRDRPLQRYERDPFELEPRRRNPSAEDVLREARDTSEALSDLERIELGTQRFDPRERTLAANIGTQIERLEVQRVRRALQGQGFDVIPRGQFSRRAATRWLARVFPGNRRPDMVAINRSRGEIIVGDIAAQYDPTHLEKSIAYAHQLAGSEHLPGGLRSFRIIVREWFWQAGAGRPRDILIRPRTP